MTDRKQRVRFALLYAAAWIPVALALSLALLVADRIPAAAALQAGFFTALPAAVMGLGVIAICRRWPWPNANRVLFGLRHFLLGNAFSGLWAATILLEIFLVAPAGTATAYLRQAMIWQLVMGWFAYAGIAGLTYLRSAIKRQEEQARAAALAETLRLKAELNALRARLEPHFLFNVLQTLGALITEHPSRAHEALELLASLIKRRLDATKPTADDTTLAEEMQDVREYIALERLRLGSRLEVQERIDPATHDLVVPRFTLQPLVENSIRHGISRRAGAGVLTLMSQRNGVSWMIEVADNGAGAQSGHVQSNAGVGLSVVRDRLRLRFGDNAAVGVETSPGNGWSVKLRLPVVRVGEAETPALAST